MGVGSQMEPKFDKGRTGGEKEEEELDNECMETHMIKRIRGKRTKR